ncbi:MAG: carbohydrate-binding protein, partial [Lachnospiraceae bacterium]|nr:carbohydrate-binding protein [Lachnospiraceae bacterium]MBQ9886319.1 carbohydrate-binding protein [Lachnospiraceae bacterium]
FEECNGVDTVVRETKVDTAIVNNINNGDTMTYVVNVAEAGEYRFDAVAASPRAWTSIISLNEDGQELARAEITSTGDWNVFNTFEGSTVYLTEGTHTFVLKAVKSGFNLDKFTLTK